MSHTAIIEELEVKVNALSSTLIDVLNGGADGSIAARMARCHAVDAFAADFSAMSRGCMLKGAPLSFSLPARLLDSYKATIGTYLTTAPKKPVIKTLDDARTFCQELRRVVAEAGSMYQALATFPEYAAPIDVRETALALVREKWAYVKADAMAALVEGARSDRHQFLFGKQAAAAAGGAAIDIQAQRASAKYARDLFLKMTPPAERGAAFEAMVVAYCAALTIDARARAKNWNVKQLLDLGSGDIRNEIDRAAAFLGDASLAPRVKLVLQKAMFASNCDRIADDKQYGAAATLQYPLGRTTEFRALCLALDFDAKSMAAVAAAVTKTVTEVARGVIARSATKHVASCIGDVVRMYGEYEAAMLNDGLDPAQVINFNLAVQQGFAAAVPAGGGLEEAYANHMDAIFKEKKPAAGQPDARQAKFMSVVHAFNVVSDMETFVAHYKQCLAARLLLRGTAAMTLERFVVDQMGLQLGSAAVRPLTVMIGDAATAAEGGATWCNGMVWPAVALSAESGALVLPPPVAEAFAAALQHGERARPRHSLRLEPLLTPVELGFRPDPSVEHECTVLCCATQAAVLWAFADGAGFDGGLSKAALQAAVGLPAGDLALVLKSITAAGLLREGLDGHVTLNKGFMAAATGKMKVALAPLIRSRQR
jgi:hypothetical protein